MTDPVQRSNLKDSWRYLTYFFSLSISYIKVKVEQFNNLSLPYAIKNNYLLDKFRFFFLTMTYLPWELRHRQRNSCRDEERRTSVTVLSRVRLCSTFLVVVFVLCLQNSLCLRHAWCRCIYNGCIYNGWVATY